MIDCPATASVSAAPEVSGHAPAVPETPDSAPTMPETPGGTPKTSTDAHCFSWWRYLIKAVVVVAALYLFSRVSAAAPGWLVAVVWAALSALSAVALTYHAVVKKTFRQVEFRQGGSLSRFNGGRTLRLVIAFVASAACVAGLIMASSSWAAWEWGAAVAAVPVFLLVCLGAGKVVRRELAPLRRASSAVWASAGITAAITCMFAVTLIVLQQPELVPETATQAFQNVGNIFEDSPSALMCEAGLLSAYVDALSTYGVTRLGEVSAAGRYLAEVLLQASAFLGLAGLLGACALDWRELKRVFLPLEQLGAEAAAGGAERASGEAERAAGDASTTPVASGVAGLAAPADSAAGSARPAAPVEGTVAPAPRPAPLRAPMVAAIAMPLVLVGAFLTADVKLAQLKDSGELMPAENTVRDAFGLTAYLLDGTLYDQQRAQAAMQAAAAKSAELDEQACAELVPLINESFDKQVANVDSYLDWYYSLGADYERLANLITGTVEEFVADQLTSSLQEGVDDSQLQEALQGYVDQAAALKAEYEEQLAAAELHDVPEWLIVTTETVSSSFFDDPIEPSQRLLDFGERLGVSATAGAVGGVAAGKAVSSAAQSAGEKAAEKAATSAATEAAETAGKQATKTAEKSVAKSVASKVAEKAAGKSFFKVIVSRISSMLASRGIGAAAGGVVGTVAGPAGTVAGVAAGTAISVGVDYAALMIDEAMNRETYKAEIVQAIEEERSELLAQIGQ